MHDWILVDKSPAARRATDFRFEYAYRSLDIERSTAFPTLEPKILKDGACGNTYSIEFRLPTDSTRSAVADTAFDEVLPICQAASFVTGAAVTIRDSLPSSEVRFMQVGPHFPRARGIADPVACVDTLTNPNSARQRLG